MVYSATTLQQGILSMLQLSCGRTSVQPTAYQYIGSLGCDWAQSTALANTICETMQRLLIVCGNEPDSLNGNRDIPKHHTTTYSRYVYPTIHHENLMLMRLAMIASSRKKVPLVLAYCTSYTALNMWLFIH